MSYLDQKNSSSSSKPSKPSSSSRPAKPVTIYRRGKPIGSHRANSSSSSSSSDPSDSDPDHKDHEPQSQTKPPPPTSIGRLPIISLETTSLDQIRPVAPDTDSDEEQDSDDDSSSQKKNLNSKAVGASIKPHPGTSTSSDEGSSNSGGSSSSDEESDDDDDEEDSEKLVPIYKPVFITKRNRQTIPTDQTQTEAEVEAKRIEEEERRRKASQKMVEETLLREIAEKEVDKVFPEVDDTDGLDPEAEFEAWKLRELKRLRRDREVLIQRAKEKEELEARRMIPESERLKEDLEYAEQTRKAKPKGKQAFLQKYHHKGAFYADSEILKKHDYSAPTEGTFTKMELLPSVMQVRDFGKMSRSKWTHLAKEDTTSFDAGWNQTNSTKGTKTHQDECFGCGERGHMKKDCPKPQDDRNPGQGANRLPLGARDRSNDDDRRHKRRGLDRYHADERDYPSKRREAGRDRSRDRSRRSEEQRSRDYSPKPRRTGDHRGARRDEDRRTDDRYHSFPDRHAGKYDSNKTHHHHHRHHRDDRGRDDRQAYEGSDHKK